MDKSGKYAVRYKNLQQQIRNDITRLMQDSGMEDVFLAPKKSADKVWVVFLDDYISQYFIGYLDRVLYKDKTLSFEIIYDNGIFTEISEDTFPLFMEMPEVMIKIYKSILNEINKIN